MAKLSQETKDRIIAQFKVGKSQNWLAREYELSPATINKLCKGVEQKYKEKVNTVVSIKSELSEESEYESEYFDKEVNEALKNKNLIYGVTHKALKKANELLNKTDNMYDVNTAVQLADRASLTLGVNPRHANQQINVQTNTEVNNNTLEIKFID